MLGIVICKNIQRLGTRPTFFFHQCLFHHQNVKINVEVLPTHIELESEAVFDEGIRLV